MSEQLQQKYDAVVQDRARLRVENANQSALIQALHGMIRDQAERIRALELEVNLMLPTGSYRLARGTGQYDLPVLENEDRY